MEGSKRISFIGQDSNFQLELIGDHSLAVEKSESSSVHSIIYQTVGNSVHAVALSASGSYMLPMDAMNVFYLASRKPLDSFCLETLMECMKTKVFTGTGYLFKVDSIVEILRS